MYEQIFNFNSRPFTSAPFVKHYFASESMHQALVQTRQSIDRGAGPVVVVGEAGTGKSLLLAMLETQYQQQFSVANLGCVRLDKRESLLQAILFTLGQPHQGMSEGDLRFALIDYLKPADRCPNGVLLLIDDAQTLGAGLMDEVKLITNFVHDGQPRVRLVLAGTQKLEDVLADPRLQSLNQRISARCFLTTLTRDETADYIREHIARVGGLDDQVFDADALKAIHECSGGCPRLINQICEHALMIAGTQLPDHFVTEKCAREAWNDVQGIPGSWSAPADTQTNTSELQSDESWTVIEFGQLDDDEDATEGTTYDFQNQPASTGESNEEADDFATVKLNETTESFAGEPAHEMTSDHEETTVMEIASEQPTLAVPDSEDLASLAAGALAAQEMGLSNVGEEAGAQATAPHEPDLRQEEAPEPAPKVTLRKKVETIDPFAESFDEEETLEDRFAPKVVEQNIASLSVTSDDLESIKNLEVAPAVVETISDATADEATPAHAPSSEDWEPEAPQFIAGNPATEEVEDSAGLDEPAPKKTMGSIPITFKKPDRTTETSVNDETPANAASQAPPAPVLNLNENADAAPTTKVVRVAKLRHENPESSVETQSVGQAAPANSLVQADAPKVERPADKELNEPASSDVEREANAILERLRLSQEVSHETEGQDAPEKDGLGFAQQEAELEASQRVLAEILEQKNMLAAAQAGMNEESQEFGEQPQSVKIEYPMESAQDRPVSRDDREMIVVSRTEQQNESSPVNQPAPVPFPQTPVSTGRAERMDYQKLFDQLRDISND